MPEEWPLKHKINKLLLIREVEPYQAKCGLIKRRVLTLCDCGKESVKNLDNILSGHSKSCGCQRNGRPKKDLAGQQMGPYFVLEEIERNLNQKSASNKSHSRLFLCQCDRGKRHEVTMARLRKLKSDKTCSLCNQSKD